MEAADGEAPSPAASPPVTGNGAGSLTAPPALDVAGLSCGYGRKQVVFDVNLKVGEGEVIALFGHNGAGKTTTIKTILGIHPPKAGRIRYEGEDVTGWSSRRTVKAGMALIPSERFVFADLSVIDNLLLGTAGSSAARRETGLERVFELFPILRERRGQLAGTLSGGQQRMVSLGIALMSRPRLLMLDEPSLGLAPTLVEQIFTAVRSLTDEGLSVLLLEQNVGQALRIADRVYVMRAGRIIVEETAEQMRRRESYWDLF